MAERIDLAEPISDICHRLGLNPHDVGRIELTPSHAIADVHLKRDGAKYVDDTGTVAQETRHFLIDTEAAQ